MSFQQVEKLLEEHGLEERILIFDRSIATVPLAAEAVGCESGQIAKSLTFKGKEGPILVVMAGDKRVDHKKFKSTFQTKAKMLSETEVQQQIGHAIGGVCPFAANERVKIYLDESLRRFDWIYPSCGTDKNAVKLRVQELESLAKPTAWVDIGV